MFINGFTLNQLFPRSGLSPFSWDKVHTTSKDHDLRTYKSGCDYTLTLIDQGAKGFITIQKAGIKVKDRLILKVNGELKCYQVEAAEYYLDPDDMGMLLLQEV